MKKSTALELPEIPKEREYEDYVAAYLQAGGLYVERNILYKEEEQLLELDIITTDFQRDSAENYLIEIKSGDNWGFSEVFKVRGWMDFLGYNQGSFIVQKSRQHFSFYKEIARSLNILLIDNSNLSTTKKDLDSFLKFDPEDADIETIRFAFLLERKQLATIKTLKSKESSVVGYRGLDDYFYRVNSGSFFCQDPIKRIRQLFKAYITYKNITAKICNELSGGEFDDEEVTEISKDCYEDLFYDANDSILQVSLFVEHLARLTILKCSIEYLIDKLRGNYEDQALQDYLTFMSLPSTIHSGLDSIIRDKYFHLYPHFWQFFTYVFGGFILTDIKDKEYELLSQKTGIPVKEIPKAFDAFNRLFPRKNGWFFKIPKSNIEWHSLFPIAFSGIGANYRRLIYTDDENYDGLAKMLKGDKTLADLSKWNDLAYNILR